MNPAGSSVEPAGNDDDAAPGRGLHAGLGEDDATLS